MELNFFQSARPDWKMLMKNDLKFQQISMNPIRTIVNIINRKCECRLKMRKNVNIFEQIFDVISIGTNIF